MLNKKACFILLASVMIITTLYGCGSGGGTANLDASTSSNGAQLASISVTPTDPTIAVNTEIQFTATGIYSDNTTKDLTSTVSWSSSAVDSMNVAGGSEVAQFTGFASSSSSSLSPGLTKATGNGKAKITAKWGDVSGSTTVTVTSATLVSIAVTPTNPSIVKGTSQQLVATGTFSDNTTQNLTTTVTWSSSDTSVAAISNSAGSNGLATSSAAGSTSITATSGSVSGSTTLTVNPATLVSISVNPTNPSIALGTTRQFTATGNYSDNSTQDLTTTVVWTSSNATVANISNTAGSMGLATSASAGSTTITAASGSVSGSTTLTVTATTLVSIAVTPTNQSIALGTTQQFTATGTYSDGTTQNLTTSATWMSSATAVAAISNAAGSNGLATSVAAGSTTITAISGSISGTATLTVTPATLVSLAVSPTNQSIALGTTKQYTATGTYTNGSTQNLTTAVTWSSSKTTVAAISNAAGSNGLATSVATGSTTITATSGSISGSTSLTVTAATLVSMAITPANPSIAIGATQQFTATGTYSDGSTQNLTTAVTWSSSSTGVTAISNAAGSNGLATSVGAGSTTIKAISGSISGTTTLTVTGGSSVTLAWDAPTTNTDGSALNPATDLSQYKLYYGTVPLTYTNVVNVTNPGTTTISKTLNLSSGTYYFTVTAVDSAGQESSYSNEITKTL